jgi:hypothetical protein
MNVTTTKASPVLNQIAFDIVMPKNIKEWAFYDESE